MDRTNIEVAVIEIAADTQEVAVADLADFQLAMIGGGIGETTL